MDLAANQRRCGRPGPEMRESEPQRVGVQRGFGGVSFFSRASKAARIPLGSS